MGRFLETIFRKVFEPSKLKRLGWTGFAPSDPPMPGMTTPLPARGASTKFQGNHPKSWVSEHILTQALIG
jgi:hypothetical protein